MADIHPEFEAIFAPHLREDERLLWAGRAAANAVDERYRLPILNAAASLVVAVMVFTVFPNIVDPYRPGPPISLLAVVFLLPVVGGLIFLGVNARARLKSPCHMVYALSTERLFFYDRRAGQSFETVFVDRLQGVTRDGEGVGTLIFRGLTPPVWFPFWFSGLIKLPHDRFIKIKDPERVEALIGNHRRGGPSGG